MRVVASDIKAVPDFERGDIIVDAGNSYRAGSIRRHKRIAEEKIRFIDPGTSGGMEGARHGACLTAGGKREPIARVEPLLIEPATPGGCVHAGPPGCGHFIKLVHDGMGSWI